MVAEMMRLSKRPNASPPTDIIKYRFYLSLAIIRNEPYTLVILYLKFVLILFYRRLADLLLGAALS